MSVRSLTQLREKSKLREQTDSFRTSERDHSGAMGGCRLVAFPMTTSTHWDCGAWNGLTICEIKRPCIGNWKTLAEEADDPVVRTELLELRRSARRSPITSKII